MTMTDLKWTELTIMDRKWNKKQRRVLYSTMLVKMEKSSTIVEFLDPEDHVPATYRVYHLSKRFSYI